MSGFESPHDAGDPGRRRDCGGGRTRRTARLLGLTTRTACEAAAIRRNGKPTDAQIRDFHARAAKRYAELFGDSKGVMMKVGQMLSLASPGASVATELHPIYQDALAKLYSDAPPMSPELARSVLESELGPADAAFARFDWEPLAAASLGQVHVARLHDGRAVAVKIQYPGAAAAVAADLKNVRLMAALLGLLVSCLPEPRVSFDLRASAREMRARVGEELDYRNEMINQAEFADLYHGHPFIRVPYVVRELCTERVLCQELAHGLSWREARVADQGLRNRWAEAIWRFVYGSNARFGLLHADPHPGNYLFHEDGSVTFLDFGCVKRFRKRARAMMATVGTPCVEGDVLGTWRACLDLGFVQPSAPVTPEDVFGYWRGALEMYWREQPFTITPEHAARWRKHRISPAGSQIKALRHWTLPPEYTMMTRVETAINAVFAELHATNHWQAIAAEYLRGDAPLTAMGELDRDFFDARSA